MRFVVTVNQPGYLPCCEPVECATYSEAIEALIEALQLTLETQPLADDDIFDKTVKQCRRFAKQRFYPLSFRLAGYAHTLERV